MKHSIHYLLLANHTLMQKQIWERMKTLSLSIGQPKVLDYLLEHNGAIQKEIAQGCYIEPASLSAILNGMEKMQLVERKAANQNRRTIHIYLTEKGMQTAQQLQQEFAVVEEKAIHGLETQELETLLHALSVMHQNLEVESNEP